MKIKLNSMEFNGIVNQIDEKIVFVTNDKTFEELKEERLPFNTISIEVEEGTITYDVMFEQMTEFFDGTVKAIYRIEPKDVENESAITSKV